jgi:hypothetical protein
MEDYISGVACLTCEEPINVSQHWCYTFEKRNEIKSYEFWTCSKECADAQQKIIMENIGESDGGKMDSKSTTKIF